jgi:arsenate reductase
MVTDSVYNVLFLCTGNSARSILAECAMRRVGAGRFRGFSAGSHPKGEVHPLALELLKDLHYDTSTLRSKSWDEFAQPDSVPLAFVFTVCDRAAAEVSPVWPGQPMTAHWGVTDPAAFAGPVEEQRRLFRRVYLEIENRIRIFASLPLSSLDKLSLQKRLDEIGKTRLHSAENESSNPVSRK